MSRLRVPIRFRLVAVGAFAAAVLPLRAAPEPSPVPISWELSIRHTRPARIRVDTGSGPRTYWYVLYMVTNNTGEDRSFHPEIERVSEIESEVPADKATSMPEQAARIDRDAAIVSLHPKIFSAIRKRHARTHPFLVEPVDAIGKLRQGDDNAVSSVIVFPEMDPRASRFTLFIGGLSGERIRRPNPAYNPRAARTGKKVSQQENPKYFYLTKTLALPYTLPGDAKTRRVATPAPGRPTWVMR